jgi:ketosteroid isomerase-like protein
MGAVRQLGDPLGPVRPRTGPGTSEATSEAEPLALGPAGEVVLEGGAPDPSLADLTRSLMDAVEARKDDAVRALLAEDVVLHDLATRRTRRGRDAWVAGMRETLGETGHVTVDRHHPGARFVVVEGAVHGREADPAAPASPPQEHGFADVHRVVDGAIAETWRYVNRRGRPRRVVPRP